MSDKSSQISRGLKCVEDVTADIELSLRGPRRLADRHTQFRYRRNERRGANERERSNAPEGYGLGRSVDAADRPVDMLREGVARCSGE